MEYEQFLGEAVGFGKSLTENGFHIRKSLHRVNNQENTSWEKANSDSEVRLFHIKVTSDELIKPLPRLTFIPEHDKIIYPNKVRNYMHPVGWVQSLSDYQETEFFMFREQQPSEKKPHSVRLATYFNFPKDSQIPVEDLPNVPDQLGFSLDLQRNSLVKPLISKISKREIPAEMVQRATLVGHKQPRGYRVGIKLALQEPRDKHIKCYEVELFDEAIKNIPQTSELVPQSRWQENQNHFCLTEGDSFPFNPFVNIEKMSRLTMIINRTGETSSLMTNLTRGLPLLNKNGSKWIVNFGSEESLRVCFNPIWSPNGAIVSYQTQEQMFTAPEIKSMADEILSTKAKLLQKM